MSDQGSTEGSPASPLLSSPWLVWKFGGTSVANAKRLIAVANLICKCAKIPYGRRSIKSSRPSTDMKTLTSPRISSKAVLPTPPSSHSSYNPEMAPAKAPQYRLAVVVSAMAGITNALQGSSSAAAKEFYQQRNQRANSGAEEQPEYRRRLEEIKKLHFNTVDELVDEGEFEQEDSKTFKAIHEKDICNLSEILKAFALSGTSPPSLVEMVLGHGELWSSRLLFGIVKKRYAAMVKNSDRKNENVGCCAADAHQKLQNSEERKNKKECKFCLPCSVNGCCQCCRNAAVRWIDSRQVLVIEDSNASGAVYEKVTLNLTASNINMHNWCQLHPLCEIVFITGYICSTNLGTPATLKRNGSDYSGALFAKLLKAKLYTVWTDIDGVYTADPSMVPSAFRLPFLSYIEAIELAYFGAKILHPLTMGPCISANIPIIIRSSLHPDSPGTLIGRALPDSPAPSTPTHSHTPVTPSSFAELPINNGLLSPSSVSLTKLNSVDKKRALSGFCKAFTLIDNISLITVSGTSMIGVPGISSRLFGAVHEANCSVAMISQSSSEHSICFAVLSNQAKKVKAAVEEAFYKEMSHDLTMKVSVANQCTIICAVGERMCGVLGVLSRLSTSLANAGVNVKAVAQGASEFNITFVVDTTVARRAICAMHDAIYDVQLSNTPTQSRDSFKRNELTVPTVRKESSCISITRALTAEEKCIRALFLVHSLPVLVPMKAKIIQIASDIQRRALDPTPLERRGLPVCIAGYTDAVIYVEKLQTNSKETSGASILPAPTINDFLSMEDNQNLFVLIDLRQLRIRELPPTSTPNSPVSSRATARDLPRRQSQFVQQWKGSGRIVIDSSRNIQVAPVLESIHRMISVASSNNTDGSYFNHTETTTNDSSYGSFNVSDDNDLCSTHNSNGLPVSDDNDNDQHSRHLSPFRHPSPSIATPNNFRNRRQSFTAEDVES